MHLAEEVLRLHDLEDLIEDPVAGEHGREKLSLRLDLVRGGLTREENDFARGGPHRGRALAGGGLIPQSRSTPSSAPIRRITPRPYRRLRSPAFALRVQSVALRA